MSVIRADSVEEQDTDRAVSPVIGVILMVAITVILAAVIAAFVLDMGQGQSANAQAGITIDEDGSDVTITVNSVERADSLTVDAADCGDSDGNSLGTSAGDSYTATCSSDGTIQVIGEYDGSENVVAEHEYTT